MDTITRKTRTRLSPERRKQQLLDFALHVFAKRGIGRAGHADIAEMASVSVATVFNYFPTREALVEEVLTQVAQQFNHLLEETLYELDSNYDEQLTLITHALIDRVLSQQEWITVWFEWSTAVRPEIWAQFLKDNKQSLTRVAELFEQGREKSQFTSELSDISLAKLFHGLCYTLYLQAQHSGDQSTLRQQAQEYLKTALPKKQ